MTEPERPNRWIKTLKDKLQPDWLNRDIGLVFGARMSMSAGRAMAGIVVPVYLAVLGYHGFLIGLLFTTTAITSAVMSALIGWFSDRIGRKIFLITTPLLTSIACLFFAFSQVGAVLFVFAALGSLG
ncbi:MAG: MFS transporter, partial [Spirochaetales bacterium]|nr:MFS transporter [Spirochaetales bacterium]